ncbi:MAG TPA: outer membrane protein transport protein [Thermoanaerobaculia bacterium]|nr:outer membrane protein transport protein [Thermoanaerobaculia bacterium]
MRKLLLSIAMAAPLLAQSSAEVNAGIQFNFASPGARSLARGGAFIADASDATAAYANPAGLVNLPAPELSLELRASRFTHSYTNRGHAFGPPSNRGMDTIAGLQRGTSENRIDNVAFASVVVPFRNFAIATYRHELANFGVSARTQGAFFDLYFPEEEAPANLRHYPAISAMRLRVTGLGLAAGARVTSRLSVGIGVRRYDSEIDSITERYRTAGFYGPPDYVTRDNVQTQRGRGSSLGVNAGVLFDATRRLSIGASYRQGFGFPVTVTYADREPRPPKTARFNVPSFYGLGLSIRPKRDWSIALDVNHITYSDLARDFVLLFEEEPRYFVPDGTEIRCGSEVILTRDRFPRLPFPIAISAGAWRDPDHSMRVDDPTDSQSVLFRRASEDYHVSFGVGMLFDTRAQVHAAVDRSSRQTVVSISAMARF